MASTATDCVKDSPTDPSDRDPLPGLTLSFAPREIERGGSTTATLTRFPYSLARRYVLTTSPHDALSIVPSLDMRAGQASISFNITGRTDTGASAATSVDVTASAAGGGMTTTGTLFLREVEDDPDPLRFSLELKDDDVFGGDDAWATVRMSRPIRVADELKLHLEPQEAGLWNGYNLPAPIGATSVTFKVRPRVVEERDRGWVSVRYAPHYTVDALLTVLPQPRLASVSPAEGAAGTSVPVTLRGRDFVSASTALVSGDGIDVSNITVHTSERITATFTIDAGAATGAREVSLGGTRRSKGTATFTVTSAQAPFISSFTPVSGNAGTFVNIIITGGNFVAGSTTVNVDGAGVSVNDFAFVDSSTLQVTLYIEPGAAAGLRNITVTTPEGTSNGMGFTVNP